ncbi:MAG TPA: hypothetical protein VGR91_04445 [Stellaceae bacterium]|nr:hypothetical protein [Stellaceae bacterium]
MRLGRGAVLLVAALTGCTLLHPHAPPAAVRGAAVPAAAPVERNRQPPGLLEFVANAAPGQSRTFEDPAAGAVRVTAGREYYSAAALLCRHFTLAPLGGAAARATETRAVCRESDGWQLDPIGATGAVRFSP